MPDTRIKKQKSFHAKVLVNSLYQTIGNKGYMKSLEGLFDNLEVTPDQEEALKFLARDLQQLKEESSKRKGYF